MPTSDNQLRANRRNALKSTGPRTTEGKQAVRHNALKHGILARELLISLDDYRESADEFSTLLAQLADTYQPHGPLEELLVQQLAGCFWRLRRILRADSLEFGRTLARLDRSTVDYLAAPQPQPLPSLPPAERLDLIQRYEKALHSQLARALTQLERLQRERTGHPLPLPPSLQPTDAP